MTDFIHRFFTLAIILLLLCGAVADAGEPNKGVIRREGWSFDRSQIGWYKHLDKAKIEEKKKKGIINEMAGWTEYDVMVPSEGWFELILTGTVPGWNRDVYVDGKRIITLGVAGKEDMLDRHSFKELNLHLSKGKHSIKFRRLGFPGILPSSFELRPADGKAEGCVSARIKGQSIVRLGEKLVLAVTGGTTVPTEYEIVAIGMVKPSETVVARALFPATNRPRTKEIIIPTNTEGAFLLRAKVNGKLLRPSDFKVENYGVIDTRRTAPAPKELKRTLIHDIDCVKQTDMGKPIVKGKGFWEATEPTRIAKSKAGEYRESGDGTDPNLPHHSTVPSYRKYNSGFAYAIDVPKAQELYMLEVDYPDDDRRTVNVFVVEPVSHPRDMPCQLYGGYETGDWFELSNTMQTEKILFWARGKKVHGAILSKSPGMRAAASRIRVYRIEGGLTEGGAPTNGGRLMTHWMEEPRRWLQHTVPPKQLDEMSRDFVAIDRYLAFCRYHGFNAVSPTEAIYQGGTFYTDELEGWFLKPYDAVRIVALMCEKYGMKYIPELHLSGQAHFDKNVVRKLVPNPGELFIYSRLGTSAEKGGNWFSSTWNPLHPAIQEKYINIIGALVDKVSDSPAFGGISSRLMSWVWQGWNGLPSLNWGYGDWTVKQFEKDTGVKVPASAEAAAGKPGASGDSDRFQKRFEFLTAPDMIDRWIAWRNDRMLDYYKRIRDRVQRANPEAVLYLPYYGGAVDGMDLIFGSFFQTEKGALKEIGLDLDVLAAVPGICVLPSGMYGRRSRGNLVADADVSDSVADPEKKELGFAYERAFGFGNAYFEDQAQVPLKMLGFPEWDEKNRGGNNGAAEGAGRHILEKLAYALADQDSSTLRQGGMGYTFGRADEYNEFLSVYERIPKTPFTAFDKARDPVAVWYAVLKRPGFFGGSSPGDRVAKKFVEGLYFYAVNREPYPIDIKLRFDNAGKVIHPLGAEAVKLQDGWLELTLNPYEIKAWRAGRKAKLADAVTTVPAERISLVKDRLAFCQTLAKEITAGIRKNDLSDVMRDAFLDKLDIAWKANGDGHWWRARTALASRPMIAVFNKLAIWPENQLQRSMGLGLLRKEAEGSLGGVNDYRQPAEMLDAKALMKIVRPETKGALIDATSYNPAWLFTKVIKAVNGELQFEMDVPVHGRYQLAVGHVAGDFGAMMVSLGSKSMPVLAQTRAPGKPEKTVFPAVTLSPGKAVLSIKGQGSFGVYGVTLQPLHRSLPSPLWSTIGPFPTKWYPGAPGSMVKEAMERVDPPMKEIKLGALYVVDGKKLTWTKSNEIRGGVPHFDELAGTSFLFRSKVQQREVCYAVTKIISPEARDAEILIGCDWWANGWLNGKQLKTRRVKKYIADDGCYFNTWRPNAAKVRLKKGVNILLVKSHGGTVANWFTCYISDPGDLEIFNSGMDVTDFMKEEQAEACHAGSRMLVGEELAVELMDPNAADRYNRGVRFTPVAAVIRAVAGGREYLMHLPNPKPLTDVAGLFGEFDLVTPPPGFKEAAIGGPFVKIGVGALIKGAERYRFWPQHKVHQRAKTTVAWSKASASFVQALAPVNGYGYELKAKVSMAGRALIIDMTLKNTGTKPFETHQYLHNSFAFDNDGLKPGTVLAFPFDFKARKMSAEQDQVGREIRFARDLPKYVNIEVDYPAGYKGPNTLSVTNHVTGLRIDCETSIAGSRVALHAGPKYMCPEQFVIIHLKPGESKAWTRRYVFGVIPKASRK